VHRGNFVKHPKTAVDEKNGLAQADVETYLLILDTFLIPRGLAGVLFHQFFKHIHILSTL